MTIGVVIAAAGQGKRMGGSVKKQFIELDGKVVLLHTLALFTELDDVTEIVVVTGEEDVPRMKRLLGDYPDIKVVAGGMERQDSVRMGLNELRSSDYVLIHDGARPFVSRGALLRLIKTLKKSGAAVLAVPVKDTIKQVSDQGTIIGTPPRKSLWAIQTPQAFPLSLILEAHERANKEGFVGTDDASLVERLGQEVRIVEGEYTNIKLTTQDDLLVGEAILRQRKGER
jgi:2-C-methyl-D-erythritol 4-phosphate cytidylyltransferase